VNAAVQAFDTTRVLIQLATFISLLLLRSSRQEANEFNEVMVVNGIHLACSYESCCTSHRKTNSCAGA
jgi:hypothetical protein